MPDDSLYYFNGIDPATGDYLIPPTGVAELAQMAGAEKFDPDHLNELNTRNNADDKHFGVKYGVDPKDLSKTGWGVIFAPGLEARQDDLKELLDLRASQAGKLFHLYTTDERKAGDKGYKAGMSYLDFLVANNASPGPADPDRVPYYLMIVGGPELIPYEFQYQLDIQYAVGRICFDTPQEYINYARSVVAAETGGLAVPRRLSIFATKHAGDGSTQLSADQLATPLAASLSETTQVGPTQVGPTQAPPADSTAWQVESNIGESATKARLTGLLGSTPPGLLFTASHGLGLPYTGELLCQDWQRGSAPSLSRDVFGAGDVADDASLLGLITMHFACYGMGAPATSDFVDRKTRKAEVIAPQPTLSRLPQRLLSHPNGGALAVVGHIDRAFACSYRWDGAHSPQLSTFTSTLKQLMDGYPIGAALEPFNARYSELGAMLAEKIVKLSKFEGVDSNELVGYWTASNDARNFVVFGDPAVRIQAAAAPGSEKRIVIAINTSSTPQPQAAPPPVASQPGETFQEVAGSITEMLARIYNGVNVIEVTTHIVPENGSIADAPARASSRISLDGKTESFIPATDGKPDEAVWKLHLDAVDRALAHRIALLTLAKDLVSRGVDGK